MDYADRNGRAGAVLIGMAIGAVVGAVAVTLSNKETRNKIRAQLEKMKKTAAEVIMGVKKEVGNIETKEREVLAGELEKMSKKVKAGE